LLIKPIASDQSHDSKDFNRVQCSSYTGGKVVDNPVDRAGGLGSLGARSGKRKTGPVETHHAVHWGATRYQQVFPCPLLIVGAWM
jgi:hypothetical protein